MVFVENNCSNHRLAKARSPGDDEASETSSTSSSTITFSQSSYEEKAPIIPETALMASAIKRIFKKMRIKSPFLQQQPSQESLQSIAYFERSEIQIGKLVGEGGFSEIYEITAFHLDEQVSNRISSRNQALRQEFQRSAIDPTTGQSRYVIKHLRQGGWNSWKEFALAAADMMGEASFLIRLNHPNIIKLRGMPMDAWSAYADGRHDSFFLILDRLSDTLDQRIERWWQESKTSISTDFSKDNNDESKLQYSLQVASALEYLHQKRLVFRDLKPQNLGFRPATSCYDQSQILLFDFGFCRQLPASRTSGSGEVHAMSCVGTRRYAAPETLRLAIYNTKVDVHAWALVVWQMFTLNLPFAAYNERQYHKYVVVGDERPPLTAFQQKRRHGRLRGSVPVYLRPILAAAWEPSIRRRSNASLVCEALLEALLSSNQE